MLIKPAIARKPPDSQTPLKEILTRISTRASHRIGEKYLEELVKSLSEVLQVDIAFVGELISGENSVRTVAVVDRGVLQPNFVYDLTDTPCADALINKTCCIASGIQQEYPKDILLQDMEIESYSGTALFDGKGNPIGIIVLLGRSTASDPEFVTSIVDVYSDRSAAELERQIYDLKLRDANSSLLESNARLVAEKTRSEAALLKLSQVNEELKLTRESAEAASRAKAEAVVELQESELRLSRHIQNTPVGCISWDRNFDCTEWNKAAESIFGHRAEEAIGRHASELIVPSEIRASINDIFEQLLKQKGGTRSTNENITKDGQQIVCDWFNTPIADASGEVTGVASLVMDITKNKEAERLILEAKEDAEEANRSKTRFLATMSHEFRTPLNAVLGFSEMMHGEYLGPLGSQRYLEYAKEIHNSGTHLLELVNDILDLSAVESGELKITKEAVDVAGLIEACITNVEPASTQAGVEVSFDVSKGLPSIQADRRSMNQIVLNLLSNSIKFTPRGGKISVSVGSKDYGLVISVGDTGIGIPSDKIAEVTEPFFQVLGDPHRPSEGTGLGLSIVKSLVDAHEGNLAIVSDVGKGTLITVSLPYSEMKNAG